MLFVSCNMAAILFRPQGFTQQLMPEIHIHFRLRCCPCPIQWGCQKEDNMLPHWPSHWAIDRWLLSAAWHMLLKWCQVTLSQAFGQISQWQHSFHFESCAAVGWKAFDNAISLTGPLFNGWSHCRQSSWVMSVYYRLFTLLNEDLCCITNWHPDITNNTMPGKNLQCLRKIKSNQTKMLENGITFTFDAIYRHKIWLMSDRYMCMIIQTECWIRQILNVISMMMFGSMIWISIFIR